MFTDKKEKSMPELSIIVPVYNVETYVEKCICSILAQTFANFELILVDDGSTDRSGEICEEMARRDARIRVIHKNNGGLSSARNTGIETARGAYLGFVDSDDYIAPDMYEILYKNLVKEQADVSICGIYDCYEGKTPRKAKPGYRLCDAQEAIYEAFGGNMFSVNAVNKLYRREIFETIRYPEGKTIEDAFVIVRVFMQCKKIVAVSDQKYFYVHRTGSITTKRSARSCFDCIEAYRENYILICQNYPEIKDIGLHRLCWAYFYALDKLMTASDRRDYAAAERDVIRFLREHTAFILFRSKVSVSRKAAAVLLCASKRLYAMALYINLKRNIRLNG